VLYCGQQSRGVIHCVCASAHTCVHVYAADSVSCLGDSHLLLHNIVQRGDGLGKKGGVSPANEMDVPVCHRSGQLHGGC
jgi:hypothetical protein